MFSAIAGLLFLIGFAAQVALSCRYVLTERSNGTIVPRATLIWNAPFGLTLLGLAVWGFAGLIDGRFFAPFPPLLVVPAIIALSQVTLRRDAIMQKLAELEPSLRHRAEWGLLLLYGVISIFMIEWPWSWACGLYGPTYWWLELAILMLVMLFFYLVGRRNGAAAIITCVAYSFIGLAQYFIRKFKNSAILPNDLLALGTALAVSDQYTYSLDPRAVTGTVFTLAGLCVLSLLSSSWSVQRDDSARGNRGRDIRRGFAAATLCAALVIVPSYMEIFRVQIMYWYSINYYEKQGFLPTFIAVWQDLPIHKPRDYETEDAEQATRDLAQAYEQGIGSSERRIEACKQFDELKPAVVVVMNESFCDLSDLNKLQCGYTGPQYFNSISDALYRGELFVDVHGGGTCNSEFEFLTGNSLGYIGAGKYPYSMFQLEPIDNMARQFKQLGYKTYAMHPNYASNWNRNKVYEAFGFDRFLSIDDFGGMPLYNIDGTKQMQTPTGVPIFHSGVSDQATYQTTIDMLKDDPSPQFIFNVTMQNHGAYNQENIPADKLTHYYPAGTYENPAFAETPERLNEFLSCIDESDRALNWFIDELNKLDRPVVLVFFGDHQPSMTPDYNDAWYLNEPELAHSQRIYHTEYIIWANYDVSGNDQTSTVRDTSVDVLGAITLDAIGVPVSDYEAAQLAVNEQILATNLHGYLGADGIWYTPEEEGPYRDLYNKMALVEYLNFAEKL